VWECHSHTHTPHPPFEHAHESAKFLQEHQNSPHAARLVSLGPLLCLFWSMQPKPLIQEATSSCHRKVVVRLCGLALNINATYHSTAAGVCQPSHQASAATSAPES
jgi:hypothetical protein